jgi:hypothetical protein
LEKSGNKAVQEKISALIDDIIKHPPFSALGHPKALQLGENRPNGIEL